MKILVVEDDPIIQEGLRMALKQEGWDILAAESVHQAQEYLHANRDIDLCLLDIMLPDGTGYDVCAAIRKQSDIPVIFLTACDDEVHTVLALEQGGDDYVNKPFRMRELMARIRAVLRRSGHHEENDTVCVGENEVNLRTGKVWRGKQEVLLTAMEYKLLLIFLNHRGQILSRGQLLHHIWDVAGDYVTDNTLTVYVKRLRAKLEPDGREAVIETVRGRGYRML
ncbi:MAG: response regulator transcription factor [Clostridia bacterium]|nr:response regulator transcription factor [Clostridia bacterium]